jgi:glucosyl-3-phosphoglycerate synthase
MSCRRHHADDPDAGRASAHHLHPAPRDDEPTTVARGGEDIGQTILRETESGAQLVVMGATVPHNGDGIGTLRAGCSACSPETIAQHARPTVIVVKTRDPVPRLAFEQRAQQAETLEAADRAAEAGRSVPARVDRWFAESNFHHSEFSDLRRLVALKEKQGLTISAILPTLNEAETIGAIVRQTREQLMERVPLVDELLVIDSDSQDATREIAANEGARVVNHSDVLTQYGSYRGKGEALWKSLFETSGDLIAWSDTDIKDWHPRFSTARSGRCCPSPASGYTKAYYQRPIVEAGLLKEGGGGSRHGARGTTARSTCSSRSCRGHPAARGEYAGRR